MITAIIGANYGDEGKGLATNYFTREGKNLVVRHNGGAQSGHTVEVGDKRFVFHELSSGSFNSADTFWDSTYHPDLFVLRKECESFKALTGFLPKIYAAKDVKITTIDDVLLNCFKESQHKNGSCGMGIWECVCRNVYGYAITLREVQQSSTIKLFEKFRHIRDIYTIPRLTVYIEQYGKLHGVDYANSLRDDQVLANYVAEIKENLSYISLVDNLNTLLDNYDNVVFESGQGLLIDGDQDITHGTPSKTGLFNVAKRLTSIGKHLDEVVYVTRTYLTRHGRGELFGGEIDTVGYEDKTNVYNEWQEGMRYGSFDTVQALNTRITSDCLSCGVDLQPHLLVTHADRFDGKMLTKFGPAQISDLNYEKIYVSDNRFTVSNVITKETT